MTMIIYPRGSSRPGLLELLSRPVDLAIRLRDLWRRRQTERMLEGLDPDIRKDIGWPTSNTHED